MISIENNKTSSLVSIIIPTYNRGGLIGETLDSVLAQTYENWECIIVDDGSTDFTEELLLFYSEKDPRIKYHHRPKNKERGANVCRNYGFKLSQGEYIQYLDSDDLISQSKIEEQMILLKDNPDALATTRWGVFQDNERDYFNDLPSYQTFTDPECFLSAMFRSHGYFPPHAYLIPRTGIEKTGGWNEYLSINQDGEFMIRIICNCKIFLFSDKSYVLYRLSRKDSVSVINQKNIFDFYHSWKLIEAFLQIRFKGKIIADFEKIKRKAFLRIPEELSFIYRQEEPFFAKFRTERKRRYVWKKNLKKFLKKFFIRQ